MRSLPGPSHAGKKKLSPEVNPHFGIDCPEALARVLSQFPEQCENEPTLELSTRQDVQRKGPSMSIHSNNNYPRLHNAMWPGLVGKGSPGAESFIDLDTMLDLTAGAEVDGIKFDGVDIFLFDPHVNIDASDDDLTKLAAKVAARGFVIGSVVAPIWPPTGGGSAMGSEEERKKFVEQVRKGCRIAAKLRELGLRRYGVVRIDSACGPGDWLKDPEGNRIRVAQTFRDRKSVV